jgi:hypothetical protein
MRDPPGVMAEAYVYIFVVLKVDIVLRSMVML